MLHERAGLSARVVELVTLVSSTIFSLSLQHAQLSEGALPACVREGLQGLGQEYKDTDTLSSS